MTQLDPSRYRKLTHASPVYGQSNGLYYDEETGNLVITMNDTIVATVTTSGITADLEITSEARGDILRRGASAWERHVAKTSGQILLGDGTDVVSTALTGDVAITGAGLTTVTDLTIATEARGDLLRREAAVWAKLTAKTTGQVVCGDGTDVISAPVTGDLGVAASGGNLVATAKHAAKWPFRIPASSGIDTDAKSGGLAGCDQALDLTATQADATYCKVYDDSATAFANLETASAADFVQWALLPSNTENADYVAFGKTVKFCELWIDVSATVQTYTGDATTWEYSTGVGTWAALTLAHDYTDATAQDGKRSFGRDGAISFVPPANWASVALDGVTAYWVRCNAGTAANISQVGITNSVRHYTCAPTDGFKVPHAGTITDIRLADEAGTVHTTADVKFVLVNFTTGAHSGELTFPVDKRNDAWAALTLAVAAGDNLGVLITQEDGAAEIGPFTLELGVTLT